MRLHTLSAIPLLFGLFALAGCTDSSTTAHAEAPAKPAAPAPDKPANKPVSSSAEDDGGTAAG